MVLLPPHSSRTMKSNITAGASLSILLMTPLVVVVMLAPQNTEAWTIPSMSSIRSNKSTLSTTTTTTTTTKAATTTTTTLRNNMFDWLNPSKEKDTTQPANDFFSNWFQVNKPPASPKDKSIHYNTKKESEQAEDEIQNELLDIYAQASVPGHLYDTSRLSAQMRRELSRMATTTTTTKEDRKATTAAAALSAPSAAAAAAAAVRPIPSRIVRNPNPYNRFLEQAEEAIEHELHDMYADASVPQHMYDETRGVGKEDDLVTTAAKDEEEEEESSSSKIGSSSSSSTIVDPTIHKGIVQWFDPKKGYGFLQEATSEEEAASAVFVHHSGIQDHERDRYYHKLLAHESVEFQIAYDKYGRTRAVHVTGPHGTPVKAILQQQLDENNQQ